MCCLSYVVIVSSNNMGGYICVTWMVISAEELYPLVTLSNIGGYLIIYSAHQGQVIKFNELGGLVKLSAWK